MTDKQPLRCPHCNSDVEFIPEHNKLYCPRCHVFPFDDPSASTEQEEPDDMWMTIGGVVGIVLVIALVFVVWKATSCGSASKTSSSKGIVAAKCENTCKMTKSCGPLGYQSYVNERWIKSHEDCLRSCKETWSELNNLSRSCGHRTSCQAFDSCWATRIAEKLRRR